MFYMFTFLKKSFRAQHGMNDDGADNVKVNTNYLEKQKIEVSAGFSDSTQRGRGPSCFTVTALTTLLLS